MHSEGWWGRLWSKMKSAVVQDMPSSLEECEACREVDCTQERWRTCERRLAAEAARLAAAGTSTGKTDEVPGISAAPDAAAPPAAPRGTDPAASYEQRETYARRRKISLH
jgi:hypothetical protein